MMRNRYEERGEDTVIFLNHKGTVLETLIETADLSRVSSFDTTWYALFDNKTKSYYVVGKVRLGLKSHKQLRLNRVVMDTPEGMVADHIFHDTLDNRRRNLRNTTYSRNTHNRKGGKISTTKSNMAGVRRYKTTNQWVVDMMIEGKKIFEKFDTQEQAVEYADKIRSSHIAGSEATCL